MKQWTWDFSNKLNTLKIYVDDELSKQLDKAVKASSSYCGRIVLQRREARSKKKNWEIVKTFVGHVISRNELDLMLNKHQMELGRNLKTFASTHNNLRALGLGR